jgi:hypothetical protein
VLQIQHFAYNNPKPLQITKGSCPQGWFLPTWRGKTCIAIMLMDNDWHLQKTLDKAMNLVVTSP